MIKIWLHSLGITHNATRETAAGHAEGLSSCALVFTPVQLSHALISAFTYLWRPSRSRRHVFGVTRSLHCILGLEYSICSNVCIPPTRDFLILWHWTSVEKWHSRCEWFRKQFSFIQTLKEALQLSRTLILQSGSTKDIWYPNGTDWMLVWWFCPQIRAHRSCHKSAAIFKWFIIL